MCEIIHTHSLSLSHTHVYRNPGIWGNPKVQQMIEQQDAAPARGAAGRGQSKKDVQRRQATFLKSQCPSINYAVKSQYTDFPEFLPIEPPL